MTTPGPPGGRRGASQRRRFAGHIAGVGSASGVRIVVGRWHRTPLGGFADAMVERADGHRVLLAPRQEVADFIAATYEFDEVRIEPFTVAGSDRSWSVRSDSLRLDLAVGRRTWLGMLLALVPTVLATAPWWCAVTDPIARRVLRGVRTRGTTRDGSRREWYGATGNRTVIRAVGAFDGQDLGALARVEPAPSFGFSSTPPRPSVTAVVTTVESPAAD